MECNELQQQGEENCTFYLEGVGCREQESFITFFELTGGYVGVGEHRHRENNICYYFLISFHLNALIG